MKNVKPLLAKTYLALSLAFPLIALAAPGYQSGANLPTSFAQTINAANYGVIANDGQDDAAALQAIIDQQIALNNAPTNRVAIQLPAGELHFDDEVHVDRSGVVILGAGSGAQGTRIVLRSWQPYTVDSEGAPAFDKKYWPGFGAFRVETRLKHANEPNYEGSINFHWKHSIDFGQAAQLGDTQLTLESGGAGKFSVGSWIYVGAANDTVFLNQGQVPTSKRNNSHIKTGHMRTQIFKVIARNTSNNTVTLDKPLEFDVPLKNDSDYKSRVMPVSAVDNVGFRDFSLTMSTQGTACTGFNAGDFTPQNPNGVGHRYENLCPSDALHGIIFKWAVNGWVDNIKVDMMGSHPIVTEFAKQMTFRNSVFNGSWNKGAGGNGYFRGSKLFDSLIQGNSLKRLRHLTLQWSATGNVVENNTLDCDINLHGGWERNNLIRNNTVAVPFEHRSWSNGQPGDGTWQPIWYGSGDHASDWSGPTGPNNVFVNNQFSKALSAGSSIQPWGLFDTPDVSYAFAWDGANFKHLNISGTPIDTWTQDNAVAVAGQMPLSGVYTGGDGGDGGDGSDGGDNGDSSCANYVDIAWNLRTEVTLSAGTCVRFTQDLAGETLQVWDSDANSSCDFRGSITSVDGAGSVSVTSNYLSSNALSGKIFSLAPNNNCAYVKLRAY